MTSSEKDLYVLYIYIDPSLSSNLKEKYIQQMNSHNLLVDQYLHFINSSSHIDSNVDMADYCFNAGFDLYSGNIINEEYLKYNGNEYIINEEYLKYNYNIILDHKIKCAMKFNGKYVSYYLYSRSSTATKTPLRLANSVGIIDSGYRGNIKSVFDINLAYFKFNKDFTLESNNRYVQITPPDLSNYPMKVVIVDDITKLGNLTSRGTLGFGSTGN
tara:strand:- start:115 stop:759 length:645 start_codon:yes stop_codon:yes gene_type:complete